MAFKICPTSPARLLDALRLPRALPLPRLEALALGYLALPYFLFFVGWLRPGFSAGMCLVLVAGLWHALRRQPAEAGRAGFTPPAPLSRRVYLTAALVAGAVMAIAGTGGFGYQHGDHLKHNALLYDLVFRPWPVAYSMLLTPEEQAAYQSVGPFATLPLSYYLANYLPAAIMGKVLGWTAANACLFAWTWLGMWLGFCWFAANLARGRVAALLLFPLLSGMDYFGTLLVPGAGIDPTRQHLEWWAGFAQFSSNLTLILWTPQHAIPGWILTGALLYRSQAVGRADNHGLLVALSAFWSPFVTVGLAPFAAFGAAATRCRRLLSFQNVVTAPLVGLVLAWFYAGHDQGGIPSSWVWGPAGRVCPDTLFDAPLAQRMLWFYVLEFGVIAALVAMGWSHRQRPWLGWFCLTLALLSALPLYRFGTWGDLTMRGSIPALFVLWTCVIRCLAEPGGGWRQRTARPLLGMALLLGAVWPGLDFWNSLCHFQVLCPNSGQIRNTLASTGPLRKQYVAAHGDTFWRFFKPAQARSGPPVLITLGHPLETTRCKDQERGCRCDPSRPCLMWLNDADAFRVDGQPYIRASGNPFRLYAWSPRCARAQLAFHVEPELHAPTCSNLRVRVEHPFSGNVTSELGISHPSMMTVPLRLPAGFSSVVIQYLETSPGGSAATRPVGCLLGLLRLDAAD